MICRAEISVESGASNEKIKFEAVFIEIQWGSSGALSQLGMGDKKKSPPTILVGVSNMLHPNKETRQGENGTYTHFSSLSNPCRKHGPFEEKLTQNKHHIHKNIWLFTIGKRIRACN